MDRVVLLHSSGFSSRQWKRLAAELGERAVVPDLAGHGNAEPWPEPTPFSFHVDVDRVAALVRSLGGAHVVGHSYGGFIALQVALAEPAAVRSLQVFDPVAFGALDPDADRDARAILDALDLTWDDPVRWLRMFVDFWSGAGAWDGLREPARAEFLRVGWVLREGVRTLMADTTPLAAYGALRIPVHVMTGEQSPLPARRVDERLVAAIAGARLSIVPGGHLAPVTEPAIVNRLVIEALDAAPRRG